MDSRPMETSPVIVAGIVNPAMASLGRWLLLFILAGSWAPAPLRAAQAVVHSEAPLDATAYRVAAEPDLVIGEVAGAEPYLFRSIASARAMYDGRIVVVDGAVMGSTDEIRVFSPTGEHLVTLGGQGEGPGEFQSFPMIELIGGDTILAWDLKAQRLSWFLADGTLLRDESLAELQLGFHLSYMPRAYALGGNGEIAGLRRAPLPPREDRRGTVPTTATIEMWVPGSPTIRRLGEFDNGVRFWPGDTGFRGLIRPVFPVVTGNWALLDDPLRVVVADHAREGWALQVRSGVGGQVIERITADIPRRAMDRSLRREERDYLRAQTSDWPAAQRGSMNGLDMPERPPAIQSLFTTRDRIVVQRWREPWKDDPTFLDVFDSDGRWLRSISFDHDGPAEVHDVTDEFVLFRAIDDLGVESVCRHPIVSQSGTGESSPE